MLTPDQISKANATVNKATATGGVSPSQSMTPEQAQEWINSLGTPQEGENKPGFFKSLVSAPATMIARPFQAAQSAGQYAGSNSEELDKVSEQGKTLQLQLQKMIADKKARGEDTSHMEKTLTDIQATPDFAANEAAAQRGFKPAAGGIVAPAPENFHDVKKDVGRAFETVALGAGGPVTGGALFGFGNAMENDESVPGIIFSTLAGGAFGKVADVIGKPIFNAAGKLIAKVTPEFVTSIMSRGYAALRDFADAHGINVSDISGFDNKAPSKMQNFLKKSEDAINKPLDATGAKLKSYTETAVEKAQKMAEDMGIVKTPAQKAAAEVEKTTGYLKGTEDTMNKHERIDAINEGRLQATKLGGKEFTPTTEEKRAGEILTGQLKGNPVKDVKVVKAEISKRGKEAEEYLAKNAKPISNEEDYNMFQAQREKSSKYMTDTEQKAYDEQVKIFSKQLPGRGKYDTSTYYKALKEYEDNVADKLPKGKTALLDPTGVASAKLRAAADVRKVVRDMIGQKNAEFQPQMYDLASLYEAKSTLLTKADQLEGNKITRFMKHPGVRTGLVIGGGYEALKHGASAVNAASGN